MKLLPAVIAASMLAVPFTGCLDPSIETPTTYSISRHVNMDVNSENLKEAEGGDVFDPYLFVDSSFVVRVGVADLLPSDLVITYETRDGASVSRPLSDFTEKPVLLAGDEVRVPDASLVSGASLAHQGVEVANRQRTDTAWWTVGGYPIGWRMDPGAVLGYEVSGGVSEQAKLTDIRLKDLPYVFESVEGRLSFEASIRGDLELGAALEDVEAESRHRAHGLEWEFDGNFRVPALLHVVGRNASSDERVDAGVELLPSTGYTLDVAGVLWLGEEGFPVLAEVHGGKIAAQADAIAWVNGIAEAEEDEFSCFGKTREDQCRPSEWDLEESKLEETIDPESENLDVEAPPPDPAVLANLTAFLAEDLRPGDEIVVKVDIDSNEFSLGDEPRVRVKWDAHIKAESYESVPVRAGTFDAIKVIERIQLHLEVDEVVTDEGKVFKGVTIDQGVVDATFWFERDTFVPLRIDQSFPMDLGKALGAFIDAAGPEFWDEAPIQPIDSRQINWVAETHVQYELTRHSGESRFSPWLVLFGLNSAGPFAGGLGAMSGRSFFGMGDTYPYEEDAPASAEEELEAFPQLILVPSDGEHALGALEHRGGEPLTLHRVSIAGYRGDQYASVAFSREEACDEPEFWMGDDLEAGDKLYLCAAYEDWHAGDLFRVEITSNWWGTKLFEASLELTRDVAGAQSWGSPDHPHPVSPEPWHGDECRPGSYCPWDGPGGDGFPFLGITDVHDFRGQSTTGDVLVSILHSGGNTIDLGSYSIAGTRDGEPVAVVWATDRACSDGVWPPAGEFSNGEIAYLCATDDAWHEWSEVGVTFYDAEGNAVGVYSTYISDAPYTPQVWVEDYVHESLAGPSAAGFTLAKAAAHYGAEVDLAYYTLVVLRNGDPATATFGREPGCADGTDTPARTIDAMDLLYVCAVDDSWTPESHFTLRLVDSEGAFHDFATAVY